MVFTTRLAGGKGGRNAFENELHRLGVTLPHQATPATANTARPKANPANRTDTHNRVRHDRIDQAGVITLRLAGRLHHIGIGRTHAHTRVLVLVHDLNISIINPTTGQLPRQLTLDPTKDYQPRGTPTGRPKKKSEPKRGFGPIPMS